MMSEDYFYTGKILHKYLRSKSLVFKLILDLISTLEFNGQASRSDLNIKYRGETLASGI